MALHRCQGCNARVPRARICVRCGAPQPPRWVRNLLVGTGLGAVAFSIGLAFYSLEANVPEYRVPEPSEGEWAGEADFGPEDIRPNVPSLGASLFSALNDADAGT